MPNDYLKKQPNKTEKMLYELFVRQDEFGHSLYSTNSFLAAVGLISKIEPAKIAEMLTEKREELKEYTKQVNEKIEEIEKKNQDAQIPEKT